MATATTILPGALGQASVVDPAAVQQASDSDREWFANRWGVTYRSRRAIPGELPDHVWPADHIRMVLVYQHSPGARARYPLSCATTSEVEGCLRLSQAALERIHQAGKGLSHDL